MRAPPATAAVVSPVEIAYWLGSRRVLPTAAEIVERTGCSRASAYRWRAFALAGGCSVSNRARTLPRATVEVLATPRRCKHPVPCKDAASLRVVGALRLGAATERQLSKMLDMPPATAQSTIRVLHARGVIHPAGHTPHCPLSRRRGGAIRWELIAGPRSIGHIGGAQ